MLSIFWSYKMGHDASLPNVSSMIFFSKYYTTITVLFDQTLLRDHRLTMGYCYWLLVTDTE
jgi:hypothetical protein